MSEGKATTFELKKKNMVTKPETNTKTKTI